MFAGDKLFAYVDYNGRKEDPDHVDDDEDLYNEVEWADKNEYLSYITECRYVSNNRKLFIERNVKFITDSVY